MVHTFHIIYIPCDSSTPLEEWDFTWEGDDGNDKMMKRLKKHFHDTQSAEMTSEGKEVLKKQMKERLTGSGHTGEVPEEMLSMLSTTQMVQPVALMPGGPHNGFLHTNLYVDDQGQLKDLPTNNRASDLTMQAGAPHQVHGDAFVGRIVDDGNDLYERRDMRLSELSSDAPWVLEAKAFHSNDGERKKLASELQQQVGAATSTAPTPMQVDPEPAAEVPTTMGSYNCSQDEEEVTVEVLVPAGTKAKNVSVVFKQMHVVIKVNTLPEEQQTVLDADVGGKVDCDESTWSLSDAKGGRQLTVTIAKLETMKGNWAQPIRDPSFGLN